jgi:hypothetical protein
MATTTDHHSSRSRARSYRFQKLRYRFDNAFAIGTGHVMAWLAVLTLLIAVFAGMILAVVHIRMSGDQNNSVAEDFWASLLRMLDPGTMGGDDGWRFRIVALVVTLGGIVVVSVLIGLIANSIDRRLERIRKGRSSVIESGHTLILGWSSKLGAIVSELGIANENQRDAAIVVLASRDRVEMEDELRPNLRRRGPTRLVCRTGSPSDLGDLDMVAARSAKSVVVLRPETADGDAHVVRAVIALLHGPLATATTPIVVEVGDAKTAHMLARVTDHRVTTVVSTEVIARITAQVCHQRGLSAAYQELLDFAGDEIYFALVEAVHGHSYGNAVNAFEDASLMGIRRASGEVLLAPPPSLVIEQGDEVIALAEDDDRVTFTGFDLRADSTAPVSSTPIEVPVEHTVIFGWNELGPQVLAELDRCVGKGSTAAIAVDEGHEEHRWLKRIPPCVNLEVTIEEADLSVEGALARILTLRPVDHVVVLGYRTGMSPAAADARTLMILLGLQHDLDAIDGPAPGVVAELRDATDVALVTGKHADDFIVSERLTALMIAQLSESIGLHTVLNALFDGDDITLMVVPAGDLAPLGTRITYADVVQAGIARGDSVLGLRQVIDGLLSLRLNVPKSTPVTLSEGDQIVLLHALAPLTAGTGSIPAPKPADPAKSADSEPFDADLIH